MLMGSYYLIISNGNQHKKRNRLIMELGCVLHLIILGAVTNCSSLLYWRPTAVIRSAGENAPFINRL
jgi:hypothetical protein